MYTYRNKTDQELTIPNVGVIAANGTITSENKLENTNLEEVKTESKPEKGKDKE